MTTLDPQFATKVLVFHVGPVLRSPFAPQTQMADLEQSHGLCESLARQREEAQRENERLRSSYKEAERTLGARERVHRHRVKGLEEQVNISCQNQTFSGSQGRADSCGFPDPFLVCCAAAGIHPEGAAAAGDEETTTFSSLPPNVYRKLRKDPTAARHHDNRGTSTRPD